jgi:hypothetical protein
LTETQITSDGPVAEYLIAAEVNPRMIVTRTENNLGYLLAFSIF